jgi:hypothetical protein
MVTYEFHSEEHSALPEDYPQSHKEDCDDLDDAECFDKDVPCDIGDSRWHPCGWSVRADEKEALLFETDELADRVYSSIIDRAETACEMDWRLSRLIHIRRDLDLTMGELLTLLRRKKEGYLGYSTIGAFAAEHLSFSGRLASEMMRNHEILSVLPLAKKAYLKGELGKSALRHLSRIMTRENEAEWLSKARKLSIRALEKAVKMALEKKEAMPDSDGDGLNTCRTAADLSDNTSESGSSQMESDGLSTFYAPSEESDEKREGVMMRFNVSPVLALVWDFALQHYRDSEQYNGPVSGFVDSLIANYTASARTGAPDGNAQPVSELPVFYRCHIRNSENNDSDDGGEMTKSGNDMSPSNQLSDIEPAGTGFFEKERTGDDSSISNSGGEEDGFQITPWIVVYPPSLCRTPVDLRDTAERLIRLASIRQAVDVAMGKLLRVMRNAALFTELGCDSIDEYGEMRLDLSGFLVQRLIRIATGFRKHRSTYEAFRKGLITKEQARLILPIINDRNERIWIDYAAHSPTVTLREEAERVLRIMEYDCFASHSYNILPGFRYITDDRFDELPEEIREAIRTGSWYDRHPVKSAWPLDEDDEQSMRSRDRRLEEPWRYFDDLDELRAYEAELAGRKGRISIQEKQMHQADMDQQKKNLPCASCQDPASKAQHPKNLPCASCQDPAPKAQHPENLPCASYRESAAQAQQSGICTCASCRLPAGIGHRNSLPEDPGSITEIRMVCTIPEGVCPAETFLLDILADDNNNGTGIGTMQIHFFLPKELYDLWNGAVMGYLQMIAAAEAEKRTGYSSSGKKNTDSEKSADFQSFLAILLRDYINTEKIHFKASRHYGILKRDRFRCQVPGCRCRRNLHIHHILWRSRGGGDEHSNLITLCMACHTHILHGLMALKIEGQAPHNLTFTFGSVDTVTGDYQKPFLIYRSGRKVIVSGGGLPVRELPTAAIQGCPGSKAAAMEAWASCS